MPLRGHGGPFDSHSTAPLPAPPRFLACPRSSSPSLLSLASQRSFRALPSTRGPFVPVPPPVSALRLLLVALSLVLSLVLSLYRHPASSTVPVASKFADATGHHASVAVRGTSTSRILFNPRLFFSREKLFPSQKTTLRTLSAVPRRCRSTSARGRREKTAASPRAVSRLFLSRCGPGKEGRSARTRRRPETAKAAADCGERRGSNAPNHVHRRPQRPHENRPATRRLFKLVENKKGSA